MGRKTKRVPQRDIGIACIAFFCFYDLVHPVKTLTKITNMELNIIQNKIYQVRGVRVMLDFDLAELYQVETRVLNQAVKRNLQKNIRT